LKHEIYWFHRATEEVVLLAARSSKQATRILVTVREFGNTGRGDIKKLGGSNECVCEQETGGSCSYFAEMPPTSPQ